MRVRLARGDRRRGPSLYRIALTASLHTGQEPQEVYLTAVHCAAWVYAEMAGLRQGSALVALVLARMVQSTCCCAHLLLDVLKPFLQNVCAQDLCLGAVSAPAGVSRVGGCGLRARDAEMPAGQVTHCQRSHSQLAFWSQAVSRHTPVCARAVHCCLPAHKRSRHCLRQGAPTNTLRTRPCAWAGAAAVRSQCRR